MPWPSRATNPLLGMVVLRRFSAPGVAEALEVPGRPRAVRETWPSTPGPRRAVLALRQDLCADLGSSANGMPNEKPIKATGVMPTF